MFGKNKIEKQRRDDGGQSLEVNSVFYTLQGEGPLSGRSAVFLRLAGCNLKCFFCDTEFEQRAIMDLNSIYKRIKGCWGALSSRETPLVVITGGEPMRQNITPLINMLINLSWHVQIETAGTVVPAGFPWWRPRLTIVVSPKTPHLHRDMKLAHAWKYVIGSHGEIGADGLPMCSTQIRGRKAHLARPMNNAPVYISPMDEYDVPLGSITPTRRCTAIVMKHGYILSLQTHKIVGVE